MRDGRAFTIQPVKEVPSPLGVTSAALKLRRKEIVAAVREGSCRCAGTELR